MMLKKTDTQETVSTECSFDDYVNLILEVRVKTKITLPPPDEAEIASWKQYWNAWSKKRRKLECERWATYPVHLTNNK